MTTDPFANKTDSNMSERSEQDSLVSSAIDEGLADIKAGRVVDDEELDEVLRARLGDLVD